MTRAIGPGHNAPPPEKPGPYAIYRTAKIKTAGQLAGSANHMTRSSPTPNADPRRAELNEILIGSDDPAADVRALLPEIDQRDENGHLLRRSNSVLAVEVLVTASPEWWAEATPAMRKDWQRAYPRLARRGMGRAPEPRSHADAWRRVHAPPDRLRGPPR